MSKRATIILALAALATAAGSTALGSGKAGSETVARIDYVADGDTVDLTNGQRVRLVQIDTPEVYFGMECYGLPASATTKRLLPPGTLVRLFVEPKTGRVDQYGRLLRYVIRVRDGLNVNVRLVAVGAAARTSTSAAADGSPGYWISSHDARGRTSLDSRGRAQARRTGRRPQWTPDLPVSRGTPCREWRPRFVYGTNPNRGGSR